ncbi:hypothetical protein LGH82_03765 [Mesorhizobium sp. PAMC28654]|uniref:hypothetical protein n=1 Tax=Mesorhizobium sp. PAMC28654 TaxID=2880934 RepID=UPI001D0B1831|nr:hypothetical protein [Mesorhizobium sp. PAMC28654]UDL90491.1 hypothetical protein LGH82_03765 [Mesorhizobium sp. PAMC28654]
MSARDHAPIYASSETASEGGERVAGERDVSTSRIAQLDIPRQGGLFDVKVRRLAFSATIFAALILVVLAFGGMIQGINYHALVHALHHLPVAAIGWSILATTVSFAAVVGRDICAVYYVGARTPRMAPVVAGFCGTALGTPLVLALSRALPSDTASMVRSGFDPTTLLGFFCSSPVASASALLASSSVRRQIIWLRLDRRLAECRPHLGVDVKRRSCGAASADVGWFGV